MNYELKAYITDSGHAAINRLAVTGSPLVITRAELGSGQMHYQSEQDRAQQCAGRQDLIHRELDAQILKADFSAGTYTVTIQASNLGLSAPIDIYEGGLYCQDGAFGEVLLCYLQFGDSKDVLLSEEVPVYYRQYDIAIQIGSAQSAVEAAPAALVTQGVLTEHTSDAQAPHGMRLNQGIVTLEGGGTGANTALNATFALATPYLGVGGRSILSGNDLNTFLTPGTYHASTGSIASSLANCPYTASGFKLFVFNQISTNHLQQILIANRNQCDLFIRRSSGPSSFGPWLSVMQGGNSLAARPTVTIPTLAAGATHSIYMAFSPAFTAQPSVVVTPNTAEATKYQWAAIDITTTGFMLLMRNITSASISTQNAQVSYFATCAT